MSLDPRQRAEFVNAYTRVLITAWSSEEYSARLDSDPRSALAESGLELPAGAEVVLVRNIPEGHHDSNIDVQVALWERGLETGRFELHIPETPQVDMAELSEGDLDSIAAGASAQEAIDINCCCCPCCCCT
ncbi:MULTISPECIES: hypothetical protein [unclassified Microbispora]|uniref:hypothetical protein n=1 Tax=unclassified Microbispora TaxID=2614687 RepID=UPI001B8D6A62|nr:MULTISPECIES: hypothetical protein [unclassified Microbispora]